MPTVTATTKFPSAAAAVSLDTGGGELVTGAEIAAYVATVAAQAFPVGSVFISVVATNPATLLGYGTWTAFGAGRVIVGLNAADPNFDVPEEIGGAKTVAAAGTVAAPVFTGGGGTTDNESAHTHGVGSIVSSAISASATAPVGIGVVSSNAADSIHTHPAPTISGTTAAGSAHSHPFIPAGTNSAPAFTGSATSVVQPYIVCYLWKRTV